ncbi:tyrosine-type recombinase/integrase [Actinacidiphila sp. ITFR-21]|uniref:tyrosine-type recombinase/integrase n=1 Tax=Actinacidiphila sp. ITFR-21 TaxID=3075199 RepID=UPI00288B60EA|nr:tyrosine-type recombinase/integrase [Streptomyces sp. ITFR-21]WNI15535.1 tyrosine-type recombinase/integrase [Streptomyces sp. ITFR-21]
MTGYDLSPLAASWKRSLRARNLSANTQRIYTRAIDAFAEFLLTYEPEPTDDGETPRPAPADLEEIHREHVEAYVTDLMERTSPGNAHQHFRSLRTFFGWLVDEEELMRSPMRTMKPPKVNEPEVPIIPEPDLKALLATCKGTGFMDRRDRALLLMFLDTGGRLSEVIDRRQAALDLDVNVLHVMGKGGRERPLPFGRTTAQAMDRYLRAAGKYLGRGLEPLDPLWFSYKRRDAFQIWGMEHMLRRRCAEAGIERVHPHQFRHSFAHSWKVNGGNEDALMRIMGWRSREMLSRYGASAGEARARLQHQELSPGDRLR